MNYIKGNYRRSIFISDDGYYIGIFKVLETNSKELESYIGRTITFTGYFQELNDIDNYIFYGDLVIHEKYGEQFKVENYERLLPSEDDSLVAFLSSSLFKGSGVGKKKAEKIVKKLGKNTLKVILDNPSDLVLIPTITEKNALSLHERLLDYESSYDIIISLTKLGFNTKESTKIYNHYKQDTMKVIDNNIYSLINKIPNMTFKRIDNIYLKNNNDPEDINRLKATVIYILTELTFNLGYSYFTKDEIMSYIPRVLGFSIDNIDIDLDIVYNKDQKLAIREAILKDFLVITGGPGTGKTTIIRAICEVYKRLNKLSGHALNNKLALLSPTGRASKRVAEKTLYGASTIHRFLKWNKELDSFAVNEYNKSDVEFVIIDEASMVDTYLMANLLKGLKVNTKIVLIGDVDQLPSVGPGELLKDLLDSDMVNYVKLKDLYRQKAESNIIRLAYDIKNEELEEEIFNVSDDLTFINCTDNGVLDNILEIAKTYRDLPYKNVQVLIPIYKSFLGIDNVNLHLQKVLNRSSFNKNEIKIGDVTFREGDKVIQLTNNPDLNVFNGDVGIIKRIQTRPKKEIVIDFDDNIVSYKSSNFGDFRLAYAVSVHKAQGTETDIIILPIVKSYSRMLYKKLVYTAVTRAKEKLFIIGEYRYLEYAVRNNKEDLKRTTIKEFLIDGIK